MMEVPLGGSGFRDDFENFHSILNPKPLKSTKPKNWLALPQKVHVSHSLNFLKGVI